MKIDKTILHLCADLGSDSEPYRKAGYNVICVGSDIGVENYNPPDNVYGIIANPPCTMFSFARTNAKMPRNLQEGMRLVKECLRIIWECQYKIKSDQQRYSPLKFWMLENPYYGMLSWFLGNPVLIYQPYEFGDNYQKKTALWGKFNIPEKKPIILSEESHKLAQTNNLLYKKRFTKFDRLLTKEIHPEYYGKLTRQNRRSICSEKFAQAFFEVNQ
jgi:hypothetical protein